MTSPLADSTFALATGDGGAAICAIHLERLGAQRVAGPAGAAIVLTSAENADATAFGDAAVIVVFEEHRLQLAGFVATETTAQAALGFPDYMGAVGARPERTGSDVASCVAGFVASMAIMAELLRPGDEPAVIRTSPLRALACLKSLTFAARLRPDEWTGTHVVSREKDPDSGYRTADGWITLDFADYAGDGWLSFVKELGLSDETIEALRPRWTQTMGWGDDIDSARPIYEEKLRGMTSAEAIDLIRGHGGQAVPFLSPEECLAHPQGQAVGLRESFESGTPFRLTPGRAGAALRRRPRPRGGLPLAGVRVVDFGIGGVGPFAPRLLAGLGADVVKLEPPSDFVHQIAPHVQGLATTYLACNNGKRSISVDLKDPADRERVWELIRGADVINQNFRPGVLERLGFGFEAVAEVQPAIVYASTSGYGWAGPLAGEPCTDPHAQAVAGFAALNADPDGAPRKIRYIGFIDVVTSTVIAEGICAALLIRDRLGAPVHMETSMMHAVLEASRPAAPRVAPDGLFRTADGWIAITCRDEGEWTRLVEVAGEPDVLVRPEFATNDDRLRNADALARALDEVLGVRAAHGWALALTRAEVPCCRLLHDDDVLQRRDYWENRFLADLVADGLPRLTSGGEPVALVEHVALRAPIPGECTERFRAAPAAFWLEPRPGDVSDETPTTNATSQGAIS